MENKPTQTAVTSEYAGSFTSKYSSQVKSDKQDPKQPRARKDPNAWMQQMYPNRRIRRHYTKKIGNKYLLTADEVKNGKTLLHKMGEVMGAEYEHGKVLNQTFLNEVATDIMHWEQAKEDSILRNLTEAFGSERANKVAQNNRRLRGIYADKKIMM